MKESTQSRLISGINSVDSAIRKGTAITRLYIDSKKNSQRLERLIEAAKKKSIRINRIDKLKLDLMVVGSKHQGVVAELSLSESHQANLDDILMRDKPLILILDGIQDPHNLGACLRSAAAAKVDAVILPKNRSAAVNATVSKVASGGAEMLAIFTVTNLSRMLEKIKQSGLWTIALTGYTDDSLYDTDLSQGIAIIMGNEEKGVSQNVLQHADFKTKIPMPGDLESLNVSVATGVVLFETLRQRGSTTT
ncbi:MAG: 23S rRNA (guanosine(2251)-2'-O)-methyltransferase RlmB [Gammaproteobacteria bacterium]|nr:MAG: 23S rRNA (guanosine(2251)-2'-O)-methyltransferase RlmB [Gammaproteobacteria bacterium]